MNSPTPPLHPHDANDIHDVDVITRHQRDRLLTALTEIVSHAGDADGLTAYLWHLGRDHQRRFALLPEHFDAVGASLIASLKKIAGASWTPEEEAAWAAAFAVIADKMLEGARLSSRPESRPRRS